MNKELLKKISMKLTSNKEDFMSSFRQNIDLYVEEKDITLREISELADIPYKTLTNFLYSTSKDCNLSTAVKLARALNVSIDELVGAETIEHDTRECVAMSRNMPDYVRYLNKTFIKHQYNIHSQFEEGTKNLPVYLPECVNGYLKTTNVTKTVNIDHLSDEMKTRACIGIQIPCDHYEPFYMPNDIILLSADRNAVNNERCVISYKGNYFFAIKKIYIEGNEKKVKYISMLGSNTVVFPNEVEDKLGYVIGFLNPDYSLGIR